MRKRWIKGRGPIFAIANDPEHKRSGLRQSALPIGMQSKMTKREVFHNSAINSKGFTVSELFFVFIIIVLVAGLLLPFIRYNRRKTERTICANNLRQIGLALYIYAREHEGNFPVTLKALYAEQYLADKLLMDCPASKGVGTPENPDYVYTSSLSVQEHSLEMLVRDKEKNHLKGGKNILYLNGALIWEE